MLNKFTCDWFKVCHSPSQSVTDIALFTFCLIPQKMAFHKLFYKIQNICMINMLTFDVFSVCHSLRQSVTDIALFFWLIPQEYGFSLKMYRIQSIRLAFLCIFYVFPFCVICLLCRFQNNFFVL